MKRIKSEITSGIPKTTAGLVTASFALPDDFVPLRMRDEFSTESTALFKISEEHKTNWLQRPTTLQQLPPQSHVEFLFNDILCNRISYDGNAAQVQWIYNWIFGKTVFGADTLFCVLQAGSTSDPNQLSHALCVSSYKPHRDIYFARFDKDMRGMWVDGVAGAASTITVTLGSVPAVTGGQILLWYWNDGTWVQTQRAAVTNPTTVYNFSITASHYYCITVTGLAADNTFSVTSKGTCGCWGHSYLDYSLTNAPSIESVRVLGQSILVRNISAPAYRSGNITGIQPGKNRWWGCFAAFDGATDPYPVVENYAGSDASKMLATGLFGFKKPTEESDLKVKSSFIVDNQPGSTTTVWTFAETPITNVTYLVVAMQCSEAVPLPAGTPTGKDLIIRTSTNGEYETSNNFMIKMKPLAEPSEWRDGMEALASLGQWYENPVHWRRILSTIGSVASVGGRILSLFPDPRMQAAGIVASGVGSMLQ